MISENEQKNLNRERETNTYVGFLVSGLMRLRTLISDGYINDVIQYMELFIAFLEPSIIERLKPEIEQLEAWRLGKTKLTDKQQVLTVLKRIMLELHDSGYFSAART